MTDLTTIRDAIADRFSTIEGLRGLKTVPGEITPPAVLVLLESVTFDDTMDPGCDTYQFVGLVLLSKTHERTGQDKLFAYMSRTSDKSVKAAFETEPTLGGLVEDVAVTEIRAPGDTEIGDISYYGAPFVIRVMASGL